MKIDSPRLGLLEIPSDQTVEFPSGLPGFESLHRYSLLHPQGEGDSPIYFTLQSLEDPAVAFDITDPARFGCDYQIVLSDSQADAIGLTDPADAVIAGIGRAVGEVASQDRRGVDRLRDAGVTAVV